MEKNPYNDRITYLQSEVTKSGIKVIIGALALIFRIAVDLAIFVGFIVHWMKNDTLTFMQTLKWSLGTYWWAYLYSIVITFLGNKIRAESKYYTRMQFDLEEAKKKAAEVEVEMLERDNIVQFNKEE